MPKDSHLEGAGSIAVGPVAAKASMADKRGCRYVQRQGRWKTAHSLRASRVWLAAAATEKTEQEAKAQPNSNGDQRIALNGAPGLLHRIRHGVVRALVLAGRHVPHAVADVLEVVADVLDVQSCMLFENGAFRLRFRAGNVTHGILLEVKRHSQHYGASR